MELADERDPWGMSATPLKIPAREMLSNAPTPSIDKMVDRGSNSVLRAWRVRTGMGVWLHRPMV